MNTTYDRVEWEFLEAIMRKLGFDELWIARVMACVSTVTYSVLVNGITTGKIFPTRGIRQRDPPIPLHFPSMCKRIELSFVHC
jgi:hypothetical protein